MPPRPSPDPAPAIRATLNPAPDRIDGSARTDRREEILRHATALFARHGYRAVGMRAIADEVGVRTSSLYHHFSSKEQLLFAISLVLTKRFVAGEEAHVDVDGDPVGRLAALVRRHVTYFAKHRQEQVVSRSELRELAPEHLEEALHYERIYQRRVEDAIAAGVTSGDFATPDPKLAALALLDMLNGISAWYRLDGPLAVDELAERYAMLALGLVSSRRLPSASRSGAAPA